MRPLNETERTFAEKHHHHVGSFLRRKGLDEDEYYDVAVFGYLQAVVNYHDRPELQQYAFSTIAYNAMWSAYGTHTRKQNALKRRAVLVSLDAPVTDDSNNTLHELVSVQCDDFDVLYFQDTIDRIKRIVPRRQAAVLELRSAGYDDTDIAKMQGTTAAQVKRMLWLARKRVYTSNVVMLFNQEETASEVTASAGGR